jgi:hypothetical protein
VEEKKMLLYVPAYKVSLDHLELFFSSIRSAGGWNNNPTARQFTAAYKKLLIRAETRDGGLGNCIPLEQIPVLTCSNSTGRQEHPIEQINQSCSPQLSVDFKADDLLETILTDHECDYLADLCSLSRCSEEIVTYIAGFIVHHLQKTLKCETCIAALLGDKNDFLHSLIMQKSRGGLCYPSEDVRKICQKAELCIRIAEHEEKLHMQGYVLHVSNNIVVSFLGTDLFSSLNEHSLDNNVKHTYFLIKAICFKYVNVRLHYMGKKKSEQINPIGHHLNKLILFKGQLYRLLF